MKTRNNNETQIRDTILRTLCVAQKDGELVTRADLSGILSDAKRHLFHHPSVWAVNEWGSTSNGVSSIPATAEAIWITLFSEAWDYFLANVRAAIIASPKNVDAITILENIQEA